MDSTTIIKKYDKSFQTFWARNIDRSKMSTMICGVRRNRRRRIRYVPKDNPVSKPKEKPKALKSHFSYAYTQNDYSAPRPKFSKSCRRNNKKGTQKMRIPKNKIIYVANILSSSIETLVMVPGLLMLMTHDRKNTYVPRPVT